MNSKYRNLLENKLDSSFFDPKHMPSFRPERDILDGMIRVTPLSIGAYAENRQFWGLSGYSGFSLSDGIFLGEFFFNHFMVIIEDDEREIVDIEEF